LFYTIFSIELPGFSLVSIEERTSVLSNHADTRHYGALLISLHWNSFLNLFQLPESSSVSQSDLQSDTLFRREGLLEEMDGDKGHENV